MFVLSKEKALVIGKGFLGEKLFHLLEEKGFEARIASLEEKTDYKIDITDIASIDSVFGKFKPKFVFLAAAISNVDFCEENKDKCFAVNLHGARNTALCCKEFGSKLVFVSTDFVFDGEKGFYDETDKPNPINVYGKSKFEAEKAILGLKMKDLIIARTSTLYGFNSFFDKTTFVSWVVKSLSEKKEINVVFDQKTSPTLIDDLAESLIDLCKMKAEGLFHVAGSEPMDRLSFAKKIAEIFELDESLIKKIDSNQLNQKARRPRDASLKIKKLNSMGIKTKNTEDGLKEMKKQMEKKNS